MKGPTHRRCSVLVVSIVLMAMYSMGILTIELNKQQINYYMAVIIALNLAKVGAKFPDWDHEWEFIGDKSAVSRVVNILIHITGGKHRSRHTHSIDITLIATIACIIVPNKMLEAGLISAVNKEVMYILGMSFMSGWVSHLIADMLNGVGVYLFCWGKWKVAFVPRKLLWLHFNTGESWEKFVYFIVGRINIALGLMVITYPWIEETVLLLLR